MPNLSRIGKHATTISKQDGYTIVTLHKTNVVKFNDEEIILNSGGWRTVTTKTRMNQASNQFNLGYLVFQTVSVWYVNFYGIIFNFRDNVKLFRKKAYYQYNSSKPSIDENKAFFNWFKDTCEVKH